MTCSCQSGVRVVGIVKICHLKDCEKYSLCKELFCIRVGTSQTWRKKPKQFRPKFKGILLSKTYLLSYLTALPRTKQRTALPSYLKFLTFIFPIFWIPVIKTEGRRNWVDLHWNCCEFTQSDLWTLRAELLKALECLTVQIGQWCLCVSIRCTVFLEIPGRDWSRNQISFQGLYSAFTFEQLPPCWERRHPPLKAKDDRFWSCLCYCLSVKVCWRLGAKSNFGDHLLCWNADRHLGTG